MIFLAWQDVVGANMWRIACGGAGWCGGIYEPAAPLYMQQYWSFAYVLGFVIALVWYIARQDLSEAVGIAFAYLMMALSGIEDILYFIIGKFPMGDMPWLNDKAPGLVAGFFGQTVNVYFLLLNILLFMGITYYGLKWLEKQPW